MRAQINLCTGEASPGPAQLPRSSAQHLRTAGTPATQLQHALLGDERTTMARRTLALWATFTCVRAFAPQLVRQTIRHQAAVTNEEAFTRQQALYDLVYVERIKPPETSAGGLFLVAPEDPPMHLAKVVSVGAGGQGKSGLVVENAGLKPGDLVYCKHPWGIGPKDEEFGEDGQERRFSFLRYADIAGVVRK